MRILSLDMSLTSTGYVFLRDGQVERFGAAGADRTRDVERLAWFDRWLRYDLDIREGWLHDVDHVGIEGYSYGSPAGQTRAFGLGELGGIVKLAVHQAGIPLHIIPPGTWKKVLCGNGSLKKDQVRLELFKRYNIEFASQDTLDAWAVGMTLHRQLLGLDKPEPKASKRKAAPLVEAML